MQEIEIGYELNRAVPFFGARAFARKIVAEADQLWSKLEAVEAERRALLSKNTELGATSAQLRAERDLARQQLEYFGAAPILDMDARRQELQKRVDALNEELENVRATIAAERDNLRKEVEAARQTIVETRETAILQEIGIYEYRHPLNKRSSVSAQSSPRKSSTIRMR
ncbi:hypothetical protein I3J27_23740 [Bradyrhizobium xenonodulans]|uniref:Uncharacterized protein n=1 Tax=Bradyrhizobium xenonodulans TaxID=2736875 RepID=A0ABY7MDP7_9BRAD|nr:hypothetical protein [Bradyrhizobium xenonodulans]WBL76036.1 hypothetical protein I3J27_23740 [Bradyrhizobium xenonodulans]